MRALVRKEIKDDEYKTLVIEVSEERRGSSSSVVYEIPPGDFYGPIWKETTGELIFGEAGMNNSELIDAVNDHKNLYWDITVIENYKTFVASTQTLEYLGTEASAYESSAELEAQLEEILNNL